MNTSIEMNKAIQFIEKYRNVFIVTVDNARYVYFPRGKFADRVGMYYVYGWHSRIHENAEWFETGTKNQIETRNGYYKTIDTYRFNGAGFENISCKTCMRCEGCDKCYHCYHYGCYNGQYYDKCEKCKGHAACTGCISCKECGGCFYYNEYKLIKSLLFAGDFTRYDIDGLTKMFKLHPEFSEDILSKTPFSKLFNNLTEKEKAEISKKHKNNKSMSLYLSIYQFAKIFNCRRSNMIKIKGFKDVKFIFKA